MEVSEHVNRFERHRFGVLFVLLICVILIPPYFGGSHWVGPVWRVTFTCVLLWALYALINSKGVMLLALLFLIPTITSTWLSGPGAESYIAYIDNFSNIVYFGLVCAFLFRYIFTERVVTLEVIFAAMCLYMLMAALWAAIYMNLHLFYEGAFTFYGQSAVEAGVNLENLFQYFMYYSFVTLSTLGYGEIVPIHHVAQNWAAMEAMIGQFFIAIIMARLVSMYTVNETR